MVSIGVSNISQFDYCEIKGLFHFQSEVTVTDEVRLEGTKQHVEVLSSDSLEEVEEEDISEDSYYYQEELGISHISESYNILGIPDAIFFKGFNPIFVLELKTTRNPRYVHRVFSNELFQLKIYGAIILSNYELEEVSLLLMKKLQSESTVNLVEELFNVITSDNINRSISAFESENQNHKIHISTLTAKELDPIFQKIKNRIDIVNNISQPKGTNNRNKCNSCDFKDQCPTFMGS